MKMRRLLSTVRAAGFAMAPSEEMMIEEDYAAQTDEIGIQDDCMTSRPAIGSSLVLSLPRPQVAPAASDWFAGWWIMRREVA